MPTVRKITAPLKWGYETKHLNYERKISKKLRRINEKQEFKPKENAEKLEEKNISTSPPTKVGDIGPLALTTGA